MSNKIINYLMGQVMKILPGADPKIAKEILEEKIKEILAKG